MFFALVCVAWLVLDIVLVAAVYGAVKVARYFRNKPQSKPMAVYVEEDRGPCPLCHPSDGPDSCEYVAPVLQ
jgi:predicted membrane-bound mannosyltransferase